MPRGAETLLTSLAPMTRREAAQTLALLAAVVLVLNLHRFVLGVDGPLQRNDVADHYVDKFRACGEWIRSPRLHLWNARQLRGWPAPYGSVHGTHPGCLIAAIAPIQYVFPAVYVLTQALVIGGTFLFLRGALGLARAPAIYGAALALGLFLYHGENPFVPQVAFVPVLALLTSTASRVLPPAARFVGLLLVALLSFPFYIVPLAPLAHVAMAAALPGPRRRNVGYAIAFWAAFAVIHAPFYAYAATHAAATNRSFFHVVEDAPSLAATFRSLAAKGLLYPELVVAIVLWPPRAWRRMAFALVGAGALVLVNAVLGSSLWTPVARAFPALVMFVPRPFYYTSLLMLLALATVLRLASPARVRGAAVLAAVAYAVVVGVVFGARSLDQGLVAVFFAVWWGAVVIIGRLRWPDHPARQLAALLLVLGPPVLVASVAAERLPYGDLFLVRGATRPAGDRTREATVVEHCYPDRLYAAQAAVGDASTLDGFSVLHDRGFTVRWWWFVTRGSAGCSQEFFDWSNRVELTAEDVLRRPDLMLAWLRLNNVGWVRAARRLEHPELRLAREEAVPRRATRATLARVLRRFGLAGVGAHVWPGAACARCTDGVQPGCETCVETIYTYQVVRPFPRAFLVDARAARARGGETTADLEAEEALLRQLATTDVTPAVHDRRGPGDFLFEGDFGPTHLVVVGENRVAGWRLAVDDREVAAPFGPAVFGMLSFQPLDGRYVYHLWYDDRSNVAIPACAIIGGLLLLALCVAQGPPKEPTHRQS